MAKTRIEIFTRPGCGYCVAAKRLLVQHDLSFTEFDLSVPEHLEALQQRAPQARTVPQIFVGTEYIGGYDNLNQKLSGHRDKSR
ncbi:MAG: glutaredoxin domain-containing protein [Pseudorhodobacter sp.]|nr:glutaredoxin domain-containing protein [Pseudorhodobacter sp.]